MFKKTEGSILLETALIMPLCIIIILTLLGLTVRYHYTLSYDLYSDINAYYGSKDLSAVNEVEKFYKKEIPNTSNGKERIQIVKQMKFLEDIADQIQISSKIKQEYQKNLKKIQLILE